MALSTSSERVHTLVCNDSGPVWGFRYQTLPIRGSSRGQNGNHSNPPSSLYYMEACPLEAGELRRCTIWCAVIWGQSGGSGNRLRGCPRGQDGNHSNPLSSLYYMKVCPLIAGEPRRFNHCHRDLRERLGVKISGSWVP